MPLPYVLVAITTALAANRHPRATFSTRSVRRLTPLARQKAPARPTTIRQSLQSTHLLMLSLSGCVLLSLRLHGPPRTGRIASIAPAARFEAFDWLDHWQPIAWARDLPLDQPTKITLFDVDYAVTRRSGGEPLALLDRCPHRGAALSEGRVTSQGWMQCAYHGWAFDAGGACQSVPQQERAPTSALPCVTSRACVEHHGMLWLH
jgi:nitrite reductase/ring-hydroxylating ferredoxin subunit